MRTVTTQVYENLEELVKAFKERKLEGYSLVLEEGRCYLTGKQGAVLDDKFEGDCNTWKVVEAAFKMLGIPVHIT